ncbi:MAG: putative translation initiation factor IF-2 [archaeon GW2011_AR20]|nr:MAG: putative translation initiation factor IF-2 [archaeon GW2011_AR20]MBS3160124.1 translation initiation factor IF-2 [Candidatus Woesearchaeota archaeon]
MLKTRSLNCVFVGHVDHGKTSLLDRIRGTNIAKNEPGLITQSISAYNIELKTIEKLCGHLLKDKKIKIPGILAIDSPGHAAFTNLRKRGGSLSDIAVLVVDINEGFKPQTLEALEILKQFKTPFIVAANKIDLINGYQSRDKILIQNINEQNINVKKVLDGKVYRLVEKFYELGFESERFDRVTDFSKQIAIVPLSAKTGDGIPELLMMLVGLAQKFLEKELQIEVDKPGKGTILEIKDEKGFGKTLDVILYDGKIKEGDKIITTNINEIIETKIRGLFKLEGKKFIKAREVNAASAIKIFAPGLDEAIAGMPLRVANEDIEKLKKEIKQEIEEVLIETDKAGIIVKAESLGSLEALIFLLREKNIRIKRAGIGEIGKKDILDAKSDKDEVNHVILGFNVDEVKDNEVKVISGNIIYKILEDFESWLLNKSKDIELKKLGKIIRPFKFKFMPGYIFRQSNPAVFGADILLGVLKTNVALIRNDGILFPEVRQIQHEGKSLNEAEHGKQVAVSIQGVVVGRQINEGEVFYSDMSEDNFRKLKEMKKLLNNDEIQALKEIAEIKRKHNTLWGA